MKEIRNSKINYKSLLEKIDALYEILALYHDQPLNIERASEYLGLEKATLYQMVYKKIIPHYKPSGRMLFFSRLELNKWALMNKILTLEELDKKANQFVLWGKREWEWKDYELIYKR